MSLKELIERLEIWIDGFKTDEINSGLLHKFILAGEYITSGNLDTPNFRHSKYYNV